MIKRRRKHAIVKFPKFNSLNNTEEYLYCLILLYYPFRRENEILDGYDSIKSAFDDLKNRFRTNADADIINPGLGERIEAMMLQLADFGAERQNAADDGDEIPPVNIFGDNDDPIDENDVFPRNPTPAQPGGLQQRIEALNPEQKELVLAVRDHIVQQKPTQLLRFVQGPGGSGKSHTISVISDLVEAICPAGKRSILRVAPTGN